MVTIMINAFWIMIIWSGSYPGPCCPTTVDVTQVTQAMTNVTWSSSTGAYSFVTALTSMHGDAKCHTTDLHCLMGCITCSTNYSVTLEAISSTGHKSECNYQGFSSSEEDKLYIHCLCVQGHRQN